MVLKPKTHPPPCGSDGPVLNLHLTSSSLLVTNFTAGHHWWPHILPLFSLSEEILFLSELASSPNWIFFQCLCPHRTNLPSFFSRTSEAWSWMPLKNKKHFIVFLLVYYWITFQENITLLMHLCLTTSSTKIIELSLKRTPLSKLHPLVH